VTASATTLVLTVPLDVLEHVLPAQVSLRNPYRPDQTTHKSPLPNRYESGIPPRREPTQSDEVLHLLKWLVDACSIPERKRSSSEL